MFYYQGFYLTFYLIWLMLLVCISIPKSEAQINAFQVQWAVILTLYAVMKCKINRYQTNMFDSVSVCEN